MARQPVSPRAPGDVRGNNLDVVRRHNLSIVLGLVHAEGSVSRAELTRRTSLNRSTIAALVAELVQLGLVLETEPDATNQVGRPSLVIVPSDKLVAISVYPELDAVTIGLVALGHRVLRTVRYDNVRVPSAREVVNIVGAVVAGMRGELDERFRVAGIGVAVPGLVGVSDGVVSLAPHLDWHNEPLADMLQEATGYPVWAANDATAGAIAEARFGSGRGVDDLIYLNGGASGIGGGVVSSGTLLGGASGFAGELGHTLVNSEGELCHCGATGCLETEVRRAPLLDALGLAPGQAAALDETLVAAWAAGPSPELRELVERQLRFLGVALAGFTNMFNPRLIVLGGFLGSLLEVSGDGLLEAVRGRAIIGSRDNVEITRSTFGSNLLMIGAAELALAGVLADPAG
ncbi:ROK family transcriptional regulator [Glaciihabitans arcticus]|uniref:ROK family transcriptional regulator n=1 Tax=Glaciihabitans arcticus TaxID=2668039 RepID=A0A4V2JEJ1_9MICO|nr:ROK family transcriptional regulator [Glaciihabitans arcticus]TBN55446.1 ROK family transcriptional regulator [Glaciihabitans arcticus]